MTWLGDKPQLTDQQRKKLELQRGLIVGQIEDLKKRGPAGKSAAAAGFLQEDLTALAKKVAAIDRKLGRV